MSSIQQGDLETPESDAGLLSAATVSPDASLRDASASKGPVINRRKAMVINLSFQYGSLVLTLVHGILMVPLYLHFINEGLYGAWLASGNVLYLAAVAQGGATYLLAQRTAQQYGSRDVKLLGETIGSGLLLLVALSTVVTLIILGLIPFVPGWFEVEGAQRSQLITALLLMIPSVWLRLQIMGLVAIEQGLQRPFGVGVVAIVAGIVHLVVTTTLLIAGFGLLALPIGILAREVISVVPLLWLAARSKRDLQISVRVSSRALKSLSHLSVWTFLTFLNDALANGTTLLLVGLILGKEKVPLVSVSRAAWEILTLVLRRFIDSVQPGLAHFRGEAAREQAGRIARQALLFVFAGLAIGVTGIVALNSPFVSLWVNSRLFAGDSFNRLYSLAVICDILAVSVCQLSLSLGEIRGSSIAQTAVLASRVVLLAVLLPFVGVLGVPVAMIMSVCVGFVLLQRVWREATGEFSLGLLFAWRVGRLMVIAGLIGYLGSIVFRPQTWLELIICGLLTALISCAIVAGFEASLIGSIKQTLTGSKSLHRSEVRVT